MDEFSEPAFPRRFRAGKSTSRGRRQDSIDYGPSKRLRQSAAPCSVPFLIRVLFVNEDVDEYQIYGWRSSTIREILNQLKLNIPTLRYGSLDLQFIKKSAPDKTTPMCVVNSKYSQREDRRTLDSFDYRIGDLIMVTAVEDGR